MKNWTQRLAIFAVLGVVLSSAVLVGCGGGGEEEEAATPTATPVESDE
jgi:hypothetical protein